MLTYHSCLKVTSLVTLCTSHLCKMLWRFMVPNRHFSCLLSLQLNRLTNVVYFFIYVEEKYICFVCAFRCTRVNNPPHNWANISWTFVGGITTFGLPIGSGSWVLLTKWGKFLFSCSWRYTYWAVHYPCQVEDIEIEMGRKGLWRDWVVQVCDRRRRRNAR